MNRFEAEWQARFERFARKAADEAVVSGWSASGLARRFRAFESLLPSLSLPNSASTLDIGCGAGTYVRLLAGLGYSAVGLDYSLPSLERAVASDSGRKGHYLSGEAYALPFPRESFHFVVSIGMLQALESPERALDEMVRVLKPGGILLIETLNSRAVASRLKRGVNLAWRRHDSVRSYDPSETRDWLFDRGLEILSRVPLCLPPRGLPALSTILDLPPVARAIARSARLGNALAHTFLFVARKPALRGGAAS